MSCSSVSFNGQDHGICTGWCRACIHNQSWSLGLFSPLFITSLDSFAIGK